MLLDVCVVRMACVVQEPDAGARDDPADPSFEPTDAAMQVSEKRSA